MSSYLGHAPQHLAAALTATVVALVIGVVTTAVGIRQRNRFAAGLGGLSLVGFVAMVVAVSHVVGEVYGYLVVWAVAVPIAALIGVGMVRLPQALGPSPHRPVTSRPAVRVAACLIGVLASVVLCVRAVAIPPLASVSDPEVGRLVSLVVPALDGRGPSSSTTAAPAPPRPAASSMSSGSSVWSTSSTNAGTSPRSTACGSRRVRSRIRGRGHGATTRSSSAPGPRRHPRARLPGSSGRPGGDRDHRLTRRSRRHAG